MTANESQAVVVVIVHYGGLAPSVSLANMVSTFSTALSPLEVVVVANDGKSKPAGVSSRVRWIVPERNLGYGGAANLAVEVCWGETYVLLNNDIALNQTQFFDCVEFVRTNPSVGVLAPVLEYPDGRYQSGAATLSRFTKSPRLLPEARSSVDCLWVSGAVMFLNGDCLRRLRFDPSFFLGSEDVDYCMRALQDGWRVICDARVRVQHERSTTIGGLWSYYSMRNRVWLVAEHYGWGTQALVRAHVGALCLRHLLACFLRRKGMESAKLAMKGYRDSYRRKPNAADGPWPEEPVPVQAERWRPA